MKLWQVKYRVILTDHFTGAQTGFGGPFTVGPFTSRDRAEQASIALAHRGNMADANVERHEPAAPQLDDPAALRQLDLLSPVKP